MLHAISCEIRCIIVTILDTVVILIISVCICVCCITSTYKTFQVVAHHVLPQIRDCAGCEVAHLRSLRRCLEIYRTVSLVLPDVSQGEQGIIAWQVLVRDTQTSQRAIRIDFCRCFVDLLGHRHLLLTKHGDFSGHVLLREGEGHGATPCIVFVHRLHKLLL